MEADDAMVPVSLDGLTPRELQAVNTDASPLAEETDPEREHRLREEARNRAVAAATEQNGLAWLAAYRRLLADTICKVNTLRRSEEWELIPAPSAKDDRMRGRLAIYVRRRTSVGGGRSAFDSIADTCDRGFYTLRVTAVVHAR